MKLIKRKGNLIVGLVVMSILAVCFIIIMMTTRRGIIWSNKDTYMSNL